MPPKHGKPKKSSVTDVSSQEVHVTPNQQGAVASSSRKKTPTAKAKAAKAAEVASDDGGAVQLQSDSDDDDEPPESPVKKKRVPKTKQKDKAEVSASEVSGEGEENTDEEAFVVQSLKPRGKNPKPRARTYDSADLEKEVARRVKVALEGGGGGGGDSGGAASYNPYVSSPFPYRGAGPSMMNGMNGMPLQGFPPETHMAQYAASMRPYTNPDTNHDQHERHTKLCQKFAAKAIKAFAEDKYPEFDDILTQMSEQQQQQYEDGSRKEQTAVKAAVKAASRKERSRVADGSKKTWEIVCQSHNKHSSSPTKPEDDKWFTFQPGANTQSKSTHTHTLHTLTHTLHAHTLTPTP